MLNQKGGICFLPFKRASASCEVPGGDPPGKLFHGNICDFRLTRSAQFMRSGLFGVGSGEKERREIEKKELVNVFEADTHVRCASHQFFEC